MHAETTAKPVDSVETAQAVVPASRFCITCGYQLSGLPLDGVCPECSTRVELSLIRLSLLTDPIDHVRTLRRGARLLIVGTLLFVGSPAVMIPFAAAMVLSGSGIDGPLAAMIGALQLVFASVTFWGARQYTQENPIPDVTKHLASARIGLLLPSAIHFGVALLSTSLLLVAIASSDGDRDGPLMACYIVGVLVWLLQVPGVISYTGKLASRVPDRRLVRRARMLRIPIMVLLLLGIVTWGLTSLLGIALYIIILMRMQWQLKRIIAFRTSRGS